MPSTYRHHKHAGNFADVHKHWLLGLLLEQRLSTASPLHYLESHAGAGRYRRDDGSGDGFASGIARLWQRSYLAPSVMRYRRQVASLNPDGKLTDYPGSPLLAAQRLRKEDRGTLAEREKAVYAQLVHTLVGDERFTLQQGDGLALIAERLPANGRWLLLVDPPFSDTAEFSQIATWLPQLWRRKPDGLIALWYPLAPDERQRGMLVALSRAISAPALSSEFRLHEQPRGMRGSGMRLINPPPGIEEWISHDGPGLARLLGCEASLKNQGS